MTDVRRIQLAEIPPPAIGPDDVGIEVKHVGLCGSDVHFFEGKAFHIFPNSLPFVLGHECAGVVYETGANAKGLRVGDRVAVEPGIPCGKCRYCREGRYNICESVKFLATPPYGGALKRRIAYPHHMVYKLPDSVSTMEGALAEPLSVGMHAAKRGGVKVGDTAVILGSGCIGLCVLLAAKAWGASRVIMTDIFDSRLTKAREIGASATVNSKDEDAVERILELTNGEGADVVFETAGNAVTAAQTSHIVRRGGTIVMVGNIFQDVPFSFRNLYKKEAEVKSVFRYNNTYPAVIEALADGRIDAKPIVSSVFSFGKTQEAFEMAADDKINCIKAVVEID